MHNSESNDYLIRSIRTIPDFPKPGIQFRDVTTLLLDPKSFALTIEGLALKFAPLKPSKIVAIEARGFPIGGALATKLGCGLVLARKRGRLPGPVIHQAYDLEYGSDAIEIHQDSVQSEDRCLIIDDLLATGGTCAATCSLVERCGASIVGCGFIVNLPELGGAKRLEKYDPFWLVDFAGH